MTAIRLIVHGYGKVGRLVASQVSAEPEMALAGTVDPTDSAATWRQLSPANLKNVNGVIDFSRADSVRELIKTIAHLDPAVRLVIGTSGWNEEMDELRDYVRGHGLFVLYGANFSVATAMFIRMVRASAELLSSFSGFDPAVFEIHHRHKADMPSGTARAIAHELLDRFPHKKDILYGLADRAIKPEELHVTCLRQGENKGYHEVSFDSASDVIRLSQQTLDRKAYAEGALIALRWLIDQPDPGFYTFDQVLDDLVQKN